MLQVIRFTELIYSPDNLYGSIPVSVSCELKDRAAYVDLFNRNRGTYKEAMTIAAKRGQKLLSM